MPGPITPTAARRGDVLEVRGIPGAPSRRGVITDVVGDGPHRHYRVRWDEQHESLFFPGPGEGVHVRRPRAARRRSGTGVPERPAGRGEEEP